MITRIFSAALVGINAQLITVEAEVSQGLTNFTIVGLPDTRIQEARERIRSAIKQSGFTYPYNFRITVNLAPSDVRKEGTGFDVPIALAILNKQVPLRGLEHAVVLGELALDGSVRPVRGVLAAARAALRDEKTSLFVPAANAPEAALVHGITIYPIHSLAECVRHLGGFRMIEPFIAREHADENNAPEIDFADIAGNEFAKRALMIAAAGQHHCLLNGPPGAGKTMLACACAGILPPLNNQEALEVTEIYSSAGLVAPEHLPLRTRPFRSPHHSASVAALIGSAHSRTLIPGEITLAHHGVLFLDEFPEFARNVLEQLRQPLESGVMHLARTEFTVTLPARFMMIAAQNPCRCGFATDITHECVCTAAQRLVYEKKISGPLLDRIDIYCDVQRVNLEKFTELSSCESSHILRERVRAARIFANTCSKRLIPRTTQTFAIQAAEKLRLSARGYERMLRVARTLADLEFSEAITFAHVSEALNYRAPFSERS